MAGSGLLLTTTGVGVPEVLVTFTLMVKFPRARSNSTQSGGSRPVLMHRIPVSGQTIALMRKGSWLEFTEHSAQAVPKDVPSSNRCTDRKTRPGGTAKSSQKYGHCCCSLTNLERRAKHRAFQTSTLDPEKLQQRAFRSQSMKAQGREGPPTPRPRVPRPTDADDVRPLCGTDANSKTPTTSLKYIGLCGCYLRCPSVGAARTICTYI